MQKLVIVLILASIFTASKANLIDDISESVLPLIEAIREPKVLKALSKLGNLEGEATLSQEAPIPNCDKMHFDQSNIPTCDQCQTGFTRKVQRGGSIACVI